MSKYQAFKNKIELPKLRKFIKEKNISRETLVLFLNKEGEKVMKKESIDDIINRINSGFGLDYTIMILTKLRGRKKIPKKPAQKTFSCNLLFYRRIAPDDHTVYKKQ